MIAPHTIPHQTTPVERHGKVLQLLLKGAFTTAEIAFETGLSHADAARAVHELSAKDYLRSDPNGVIDGVTGFVKKKHYITKEGRRAALGIPSTGDDAMAKPQQQRRTFPPNHALASGLRHVNGVAGKFDFSKIEKKLHGARGLTYSGTSAEWRDAKQIATALNLKDPNSSIFNSLTDLVRLGLLEMEERAYEQPGTTRTNRRRCYRRVELASPVVVEEEDEEQHASPPQATPAAAQPPAVPPPQEARPPAAPQTAWSRDDLDRVLDQFDPMDVLMAALARLEKEVKDHRTFAAAVAKLQVPK